LSQQTKDILLVSLSCVGDAVMTTPVLEALQKASPGASIDIVSDDRSSIIYTHCPYRGRVFIKDKKLFLRGSVALLKEVRRKDYDLIVDLRTDGLAYLCKGKRRLTKWNSVPYGGHAVQRLMGVIRTVHGEQAIPAPRVWITASEQTFAEAMLSALPGRRWLALAPGNADPKKVWQADKYAALANAMSDQITGVILDGSPREKAATEAVASMLKVPYVDLAGKTNLLQAAAVLSKASFFVGGDSGLGHIAAAVSTPTLTFFSVDSPARVLPWGNSAHWLKSRDEYTSNIALEEAISKVRGVFSKDNQLRGQ